MIHERYTHTHIDPEPIFLVRGDAMSFYPYSSMSGRDDCLYIFRDDATQTDDVEKMETTRDMAECMRTPSYLGSYGCLAVYEAVRATVRSCRASALLKRFPSFRD